MSFKIINIWCYAIGHDLKLKEHRYKNNYIAQTLQCRRCGTIVERKLF